MEKGVSMSDYTVEYRDVTIKSCPLCGGFSKLERRSKTIVDGQVKYMAYVRCTVCDCRGPRIMLGSDSTGARRIAVSKRNRRTNNED